MSKITFTVLTDGDDKSIIFANEICIHNGDEINEGFNILSYLSSLEIKNTKFETINEVIDSLDDFKEYCNMLSDFEITLSNYYDYLEEIGRL